MPQQAATVMKKPTRNSPNLLLALPVLALSACDGGDGSGQTAPPSTVFGPNFSEIQDSVFTITCATSGCHSGASAPQGLRLDAANSFGLLVNVASMEVPALLRVEPGNPDDSYLIQKLEGTAAVGGRMPLGGTPLEQSAIDVIRQWISDGAIDDRLPSSRPVRVTSLSPLPGSNGQPPPEIIAMFDREIDVSTVNAFTFLLDRSGGDSTFGDGNEVSFAAADITAPTMTPMSATFDLSNVAMPVDTYRVRLLGSGASVVLDIGANALDGEFSGTFPSGDGTAGGDFEATFMVSAPSSALTFDEIQATVFTPNCATSGCHAGSGQAGLVLEAGVSFDNLVNVPSTQVTGLDRVEPGDPDNSYLIQKLEGTASTGARMPFGRAPLDQSVIDDIRQWISDGANR